MKSRRSTSSFNEQYIAQIAAGGTVRNVGTSGGGSCMVVLRTVSSSETVYVRAYQGSSSSVNARAAIYAIKVG